MEKHLHIICFTVPYPADYGGVFDPFYKLGALQQAGVRIHLHCFDYGRGKQPALDQYCASVHYYERFTNHTSITNRLPYIVSSRRNQALLSRLFEDEYPILMEGIHCSYLLTDPRFRGRRCFVRLHNIESVYYHDLSGNTPFSFRKIYYWLESRLLRAYEKKIANRAVFFSVTELDAQTFRRETGCRDIRFLPLFLPATAVDCRPGIGNYCLYHGDLSIDANEKAAAWLIRKVFAKLNVPFFIAGRQPSARLFALAQRFPHIQIIANPGEQEMQELIAAAQLHVLPSYTHTGIKLKLLNALLHGRHCIVNAATVDGTGLEAACHVAAGSNAFTQLVAQLYHSPYTEEEIRLREILFSGMFNNERNAEALAGVVWGL